MDLLLPHRLERIDLLSSESFDCFDAFGHGKFQRRLLLLCTLATFLVTTNTYLNRLVFRDVDHWCKRPPDANMSVLEWRNVAIPLEADGRYSHCSRYENPDEPNDTRTVPCEEWDYDEQTVESSIVSQWNMVCDKRSRVTTIVLFQVYARMVIGVAAGSVADRVGRKPIVLVAVTILLASTIATSLANSYPLYLAARCFASCAASSAYILIGITFFEVTTHDNRPLHVVIVGALAIVASDLWFGFVAQLDLHWALKQAAYLAPTYLLAAAFFLIVESPRWLVAKMRYAEAEGVMLVAGEVNDFPPHDTSRLINKIKANAGARSRVSTQEMFQGVSIRRRAFAISAAYFTLHFTLFTVVFSSIFRNALVLQWVSLATLIPFLGAMFVLITRVTMLTFTSFSSGALGLILCLLSWAAGFEPLIVREALVVVAKAVGLVGNIVMCCYILELFPTAVRGTVSGWYHGFGMLGALSSEVVKPLQKAGREDVAFGVAASLMFASVLALRLLPQNTTVECAKVSARSARHATASSLENVERMKRTLGEHEHAGPRKTWDHRSVSQTSFVKP
ncbi:solute carrier family 22 member 13 [Rhipicephalus sanguineus]|uniref:Uncharacterized protein n=1 Tax=Rhipicephalus sanguineus TaxID=34632 RepID=A0A9D4SQY7_RHISA|nr:solute carrier family 22 member 13 [Rhipicephalus sanguineus]KAH7940221.1 hypothetical protein HPB52_022498 [Rhipicephalus sanguineus]